MIERLPEIETSLKSSPEFAARLLAMLSRYGLYHPPRAQMVRYRVDAAAAIMKTLPRPETRDALQQRFGVSRRTAYRLMAQALDARQARLFE